MQQEKRESKSFEGFTNLYQVQKTLRFELKPVGKTLEKMKENLQFDERLQTFLKDQDIEDSYQVLKPVFDKFHEEFITNSLESLEAKKINFGKYFDLYRKQRIEQNKDKKKNFYKPLETEGKELRKNFEPIFEERGNLLKNEATLSEESEDENEEEGDMSESNKKKKGFRKLLKAKFILGYISSNLKEFQDIKTKDKKIITEQQIEDALEKFKGFTTYFTGFDTNRINYYVTKDEKATAVASRVVDENLPKFCDNALAFENRKSEYVNAFEFLCLEDRDKNNLYPISGDLFDIKQFNECLSQEQIEKYNKQIGNANFVINLYNQQKSKDNPKFKKLLIFKILYKQIGCGEKKNFISEIKDDNELKDILVQASEAGKKYFVNKKNGSEEIITIFDLMDLIQNHENYKGVYWSDKALNVISSKYFADWFTLKIKLKEAKVFGGTKKDSDDIVIPKAIELADLFEVLNKVENWNEKGVLFKTSLFEGGNERKKDIIVKGVKPSQVLLAMIFNDVKENAKNFINGVDGILNITDYKKDGNKQKIKDWLDKALWTNQILKYFKVKANKIIKGDPIDSRIESGLDSLIYSDDSPVRDYDIIRNYLTKKPQEGAMDNKLRLNFENASLADGWDLNKQKDNSCVILKDGEGNKYLAIMRYNDTKVFEKNVNNQLFVADGSGWTKMEYKLIPGASKTLPKVLFSAKWLSKNSTPVEIKRIYKDGTFKKGDNFRSDDLYKLIEFFKEQLKKYPSVDESWQKVFGFDFSNTETYTGVDEFYNEVDKWGYRLDFVGINKMMLDGLVESGKIYLFEIRNQDNNDNKKVEHKNNLHTMYWNTVFGNAENKPKLNGKAKIFYRQALSEDKLKQLKGKDRNGKEIIRNYRYSKEKFLFYCPVTLNFCLKNQKINDLVKNNLIGHEDVCFLGIDRGEKHLAYYSLVNREGKILEQGTLNMPFLGGDGKPRSIKVEKRSYVKGKDGNIEKDEEGNDKIKVETVECWNYNDLLEARAGDRDYARKNWQTIGTIKELKDGYISQVVRKIVDLAIYKDIEKKELRAVPAYIVLEDLNIGFKRGRQKIEKQVYQKLELALAKKLNFLVDKNAKEEEIGSVTRALQLTPPVNNFGDIENKKQFGIMLYTRADYTSQTDPVTGWRKSIYLKKGSEKYIKEQIIENFNEIKFDGEDYLFCYQDKNTGWEWKLYSGSHGKGLARFRGERGDKNEWTSALQDIPKILDGVFEDFDRNRSLRSQLIDENLNPKKIDPKYTGWESLRFAIDMIQQIRNQGAEKKDADFILSPIRDENGHHFDSRSDGALIPNGDANGAYNIARKGILMSEHIKRGLELFIRNEEWDAWLVGKDCWEKWIEENKSRLTKAKKEKGNE